MSADLLGLDEFYSSSSKSRTSSTTEFSQPTQQFLSFGQPAAPNPTQPVYLAKSNDSFDDDDDDGWGDFADASGIPAREVSASTKSYGTNSILPTSSQIRPIRTNTLDLMTNKLIDLNLYPEPSSIPVTGQSNTRNSEAASIEHMGFNHPSTRSSYAGCATNYPLSHVFEHEVVRSPPSAISHDKSNILFDVGDCVGDDVDEFGDFEGPSNVALIMTKFAQKTQASIDLLSLDLGSQPSVSVPAVTKQSGQYLSPSSSELARASPGLSIQSSLGLQSTSPKSPSYPQAPRSPSFQERNPYPMLSLKTPTQSTFKKTQKQDVLTKSPSPVTAWPSNEHSAVDEWPTFEDFPDDLGPTTAPGKSKETEFGKNVPKRNVTTRDNLTTMGISLDWQSLESTASTATLQQSSSASPPTNIPPPSVLMSILPDMFDIANKHLFKPLSGQSVSVKKVVMEDERTIAFLKGFLMLAVVSGRIIAGRKLRWHRDKFLSQSMTISTAGSKGMKLAGVDKAQSVREDREAADVIGSWKLHVGRLRSAIATANSASVMKSQRPLRVPEISDVMAVQTAKVVPTAPRSCALCGLKRDERILKIDYEVEDSFGEWWVEYWGHRSCKNFWDVYEKMLRSR